MSNPLISIDELKKLIDNPALVLIDATGGTNARNEYLQSHLLNARYVDSNTQLANIGENPAHGGRHPLPTIDRFLDVLKETGIRRDSNVVVYDRLNGANSAARLWWMLKSIGHAKVRVLDGGYQLGINCGNSTSSIESGFQKETDYKQIEWQWPLASMEDVEKASQKQTKTIIDVRESGRYLGEYEPLDNIAGHIPGAINIHYIQNLTKTGAFKSSHELRSFYKDKLDGHDLDNLIVHCGSGITACHTILAFAHAELPIPELYVGSWSEWSRNKV